MIILLLAVCGVLLAIVAFSRDVFDECTCLTVKIYHLKRAIRALNGDAFIGDVARPKFRVSLLLSLWSQRQILRERWFELAI